MKVAVGYLHRADSISPAFSFSLLMLCVRDAKRQQRIVGVLNQESSANISAGRNNIVRNFLAGQADWLWMVDSDMTFGVDILDRLLKSADAKDRPIMGGLCFGVAPVTVDGKERFNAVGGSKLEAFPTLYSLRADGFLHWKDYPRERVVECDSTGGACVLIHRSVLEDKRWLTPEHPFPWFRETVFAGKPCSEDHFFFLKARKLGYRVHVDTAAKTGHVKPQVVDEDFFDGYAQSRSAGIASPSVAEERPVVAGDAGTPSLLRGDAS